MVDMNPMNTSKLNRIAMAILGLLLNLASAPGQNATNPPAQAAQPATNQPARNIRFQFDGIPYPDVIERFAQMSGKPLLADTNIAGTLTFNDPTPYNYTEALDVINLILSMKGLMLVESGHYLRLVPFKELPAMPLRIMRGIDHSGDVRPGEVVTVVLDVKNLDSKEVADSITSMLSSAGSIAPLSRGRGLIITDRLGNITRIRTLLATIDTEVAVDRQMKTYTLLHASGAIVSDLLNRTFGAATAPKRTTYNPNNKTMEVLPPDPNDYITSVYDDASRTLVLFGPRERIALAEELINKFEQKEGPGGDVRIYFPQTIRSDELANIIRQAIPGVAAPNETAASAATKARVITDTMQNRLIVAAPIPGQLEQIETLINRVDKNVHGQAGLTNIPLRSQTVQLTKVFRPRAADTTNLASILTQALTRRAQDGRITTTASVSHDSGSQSVVVSGSPGDLQIASDIVIQLETGTTTPTPLQTRFIDVGSASEAKRLAPLVEQLYRDQVGSGAASAVAHAKILPDSENGRLIVTASEAHLEKVEGLVKQLRADRAQNQSRRLQIIPLKNARVETALASIQSLVNDKMTDRRWSDMPKPSLIADAPNNRLLVTATEAQITEVQEVVNALDIAPARAKRDMAVIPVQSKTATELIALTTQLLDQLGETPTDPQLAPKLMPDSTGRQILALAPPKDLERIRALVQQLDVAAPASTRQFKSVELFSRTATEFVPLVQQLYTEQLKGQTDPAGGAATLNTDAKNNRIMVSGGEKEIARVEAIVRQLDAEGKKGAKEETRVIRLKAALAAEIATLVEKSLNAQQNQVRVLVDARSNSLVVTGDSAAVEAASLVIAQLDTRSDVQPREMRIIELKQGEASTVATMATTLSVELIKDQRGPEYAPQMKIIADAAGNRLVVTGPKDELKTVATVVEQLDQTPEASGGARVFKLVNADAAQIVGVVSNAMLKFDNRNQPIRRATVSLDRESNSIVVSGSRNDLKDAETIIQRLDNEGIDPTAPTGASSRARELKIISVRGDDPDGLAALAMRVFAAQNAASRHGGITNLVSITPEPGGKRLIVLAPASVLPQVETVIAALDDPAGRDARELQSIEVKNGSASELLPKVTQIYNEQSAGKTAMKPATIYSDASGTRFTVFGTKDQGETIRQIVATLDGQPRAPRETRTFEVGTAADVQRLQPLVQQLYQDQWKSKSDAADAQILADSRTGRLIVTGKPEHVKHIESILTQLGVPQGGTARPRSDVRDTRVFDLSTASAVELATTVRTLYLEEAKVRFGAQVPDTLITPDAGGNRLIVVGETNELDAVETIVKKLDKVSAQGATARVFKLKSADPTKVAEILSTSLVRFDAYGRQQKRATVSVDTKTRTLIVTGDPKELTGVATIIEQLDQSLGAQPERKMKVVSLKQGRVGDLTGKLRQLYNDQLTAQPELGTTDILIMEDTPSNHLILAGSDAQLKLLERIIGDLQSAVVNQGARETKLFDIGQAEEVTRLQPLVQQLYTDRWKSKDASDPADAQIIADVPNGRLVATGRTNHIAEIASIVDMLKGAGAASKRDLHVLSLQRNSAAALSSMLTQVYARQTNDPNERLVVSALADDRTLVVEASERTFARVSDVVKKLDAADGEGQSVIQIVHLKKGRADTMAEAINTALTNRVSAAMAKRVGVSAVVGANSLLINGPTNAIEDVMKIVRELDTESEGGDIEVRIYKLENGVAREVSAVLEQILENVSRYQSRVRTGRFIPASISVNERANSLIVSGTAAHFRTVEKLLPTLDKAPERSDRDVQFVWLKKAKAFDVVSKVSAVFSAREEKERPVIEADDFNNSITVIARRGDLAQIQDLISRLDEQSKDTTLQVRLRPLDRVTAEQMARMLQNIYPQMARGQMRVVEKVEPPKTDTAPTPPDGAAPPQNQPPQAGTTTNAIPEVVIAVDKTANALILSGPAQELDNVDRIITDLSFNFWGNEAEFRLFTLLNSDPVMVARTLTDLLKQEPVPVPTQPGQPPQTRTPQPRITVVPEARTRSVIVRARPTDFPLLESLIKQLDTAGQMAQLEFRLVPLTNAAPEKVLPLVQQLVTQHNVVRPGDPLTVSADQRNRALLVVARSNVIEQVEKMIRGLDTPAAFGEADVLVVSLKKANANQLAAVLQNMLRPGAAGEFTSEARELQEQVRRLKVQNEAGQAVTLDLTKPIRISPDPATGGAGGGNRLVLTSTPDNLKALAAVVDMMDTAALTEGVEVRLVVLEHADAAAVSQTLSSIFTQGRAFAAGPAGPGAQPQGTNGQALVNPLNVAADPRSNTLILSGHKDTLDLAERVIGDLDRQIEKFVTEVRLFRLKHASATKLLPLLQSVFAEGPSVPGTEGLATQVTRLRTAREGETPKTSGAPKARAALVIQADDLANILVIAARADMLPLIGDVIEQLDIPAASGLETVRFYPLNHADPAAIQKILNDIYNSPRAVTGMRGEDKPVISVDDRTSALIIAGNGKSFAIIEGLLQQLDQQLPFELRDIRIVPLENADANVVAASVQRLMDARVTQRATLNKGSADTLKVTVLADQRSNALLVAGGRDAFEMVESLAKQLDKAGPALSGRIRLIPLQFADARLLSTTLTTLFDQRYPAGAGRATEAQRNKPIILADPRSNSLLVTANQEDNGAIDDLLKKLDARTENPALTLTVLTLKHNDATRVAGTIENIFAARFKAQTLPGQAPLPSEQIKLEPDALNNTLIVSASKENLELIQSLLQKIDIEPVIEGGLLQTFTLEFADAQRVATMLRALVQQGLYRPGLSAGATTARTATQREALAISVDPRSNTMFVSASPENLAIVREIIRRVDTKDFTAGSGDLKLYPLKNARASSLATTLEQFFRAKRTADTVVPQGGTERSVPVSVIADDRMNTVLIVGSKEAFDAADRIIAQLDGESVFARLNFKVFPLARATATKLQSTLQAVVANRPPRVKGEAVEPITVVADQWANAILVAASVEDMSTVESLIQRLDAEAADSGMAVHFFPLAKADARRVAQTVQGLFREGTPGTALQVTVTADERINAIVVSCGEADARRIGELVRKLDTEQVARVSEIKVFPLKYARAESLSAILNTSLNTKPTPLTDQQNPNAQSVLQFITRTEQGQELVTAALKESILITPDGRMNSLIVSGPVDYMGLLEQIVGRLDASSPQQAKIKVFTLRNADAHQMATLLMQMFRMTQSATPGGTQRSIQYTLVRSRIGEDGSALADDELASATVGTAEQNALTVTVDPRTNSLLVGGTDHYVALVSQIIDSLDASPAHERRTEVIRLKNSQAQEVATAIRTFLDQERQRVTQVLGPEAVGTVQRVLEREVAVVAEPISNTLLVSANPRYFEQMRALIDELDKPQPQVLIQVLIAELTLDSLEDLGVEWRYSGSKGDADYAIGTDFNVRRDLLTMGGFSTAVSGGDFSFLLRALKNDGRLQVLSRPQIVTADNKPAIINVGQRVPLITDSRVTERGDTINQFRYEDIGVHLAVTPKISPDGFVKMEIGTTNSAISSSTIEINESATVPIINQRRANTTVSAQSGQTILIGGLISTQDDKRVKKMPVLGDVPLLGALFRSSHNTRDRKELLILLTPQILADATGVGKVRPIDDVTRENLERSGIKGKEYHDELEKQLLEPLLPPTKKLNPGAPPDGASTDKL